MRCEQLGGRKIVLQRIAPGLLGGRQERRHRADVRRPIAGAAAAIVSGE